MNKVVSLRVGDSWNDGDWERLRPYGHTIREINVIGGDGQAFTSEAFAAFIGACPNLQILEYFMIENENSRGTVLLRAAQSCPHLVYLNIDTFSSAAVLERRQNCKNLREVSMSFCKHQSLSVADLVILSQIESMEKLALFQDDITHEHLAAISWFQNLKDLYFNWYNGLEIFEEGMFAGTPICRSLEHIGFHTHSLVVSVAALSCLTLCKNLREIGFDRSACDAAGLKILATHFPLLEKITMGYVIEHIVGVTFFIAQCKNLKEVTLWNARCDINPNDEVTEACLQIHLNDLRSYFPHIHFN